MDHELTDTFVSDQSIKNLCSASEENAVNNHNDHFDEDLTVLSNLLRSLDAQGSCPGPVTNMLSEMGICPPRLSPYD